jgi:hypothetical protein
MCGEGKPPRKAFLSGGSLETGCLPQPSTPRVRPSLEGQEQGSGPGEPRDRLTEPYSPGPRLLGTTVGVTS